MRVQTAINEMMQTISNLKTFINEANLSQVGIDSFNQRVLSRYIVKIGERLKLLHPYNEYLDKNIIPHINLHLESIAKYFRDIRDDVSHIYIYSNHKSEVFKDRSTFAISLSSSSSSSASSNLTEGQIDLSKNIDIEELNKNIPLLEVALGEILKIAGESTSEYKAQGYYEPKTTDPSASSSSSESTTQIAVQDKPKPRFGAADYLGFILLELKELIKHLHTYKINDSFINFDSAMQNENFRMVVEQHICALGQMVLDYRSEYCNTRNYKQINPNYDGFVASVDNSYRKKYDNDINLLINARHKISHLNALSILHSSPSSNANLNLNKILSSISEYTVFLIQNFKLQSENNVGVADKLSNFKSHIQMWWTKLMNFDDPQLVAGNDKILKRIWFLAIRELVLNKATLLTSQSISASSSKDFKQDALSSASIPIADRAVGTTPTSNLEENPSKKIKTETDVTSSLSPSRGSIGTQPQDDYTRIRPRVNEAEASDIKVDIEYKPKNNSPKP